MYINEQFVLKFQKLVFLVVSNQFFKILLTDRNTI